MRRENEKIIGLVIIFSMSLTLIGCGSKKSEAENVIQVNAPVDGKLAVGESYENIYRKFKSAGFTNINVDEVEDVNEDDQRGTIKEIEIKGDNSFKKKDSFNADDEVYISYYSTKYKVDFKIVCAGNLFLSKYDVQVYLDDEQMDKVDHGDTIEFSKSLDKGKHVMHFEKHDEDGIDPEVDGKKSFIVEKDSKFKFKISCHTSQINVDELVKYINVPVESSDIQNYTYKSLKKKFKDAGFKNIQGEKIEDLEPSSADINKVKTVSISGKKSFTKSSQFYSDSKVVIKYHVAKPVEEDEDSDDLIDSENNDAGQDSNASSNDNQTTSDEELSEYTAKQALADYVEKNYPIDLKIHTTTGVLACEKQADGSYFVKMLANERKGLFSEGPSYNVEGYVSGTEYHPYVYNVNVY